jgi:hypothetical protein
MTIDFAYLNSLDWKNYTDKKGNIDLFESQNDDYIFCLMKNRNYIILNITDILTNTEINYHHEKLYELWYNLLKDAESIKQRMYEEVKL